MTNGEYKLDMYLLERIKRSLSGSLKENKKEGKGMSDNRRDVKDSIKQDIEENGLKNVLAKMGKKVNGGIERDGDTLGYLADVYLFIEEILSFAAEAGFLDRLDSDKKEQTWVSSGSLGFYLRSGWTHVFTKDGSLVKREEKRVEKRDYLLTTYYLLER